MPVPSTVPLPETSQLLSVATGMKAPVWASMELPPTSRSALSTPAESSVWFAGTVSVKDLTKVLAAMPVPDQ